MPATFLGIIVAALFNEQVNSIYVNNVMEDVLSGYRFYTQNGQRLSVAIHGGNVRQVDEFHPIFDTTDCVDPAESITFHNVTAENAEAAPSGDAAHAFAVGRVRHFGVYGGVLRNVAGRVVSLASRYTQLDAEVGITVSGVHAIDCGRTGRGGTLSDGVALYETRPARALRHCIVEQHVREHHGGPADAQSGVRRRLDRRAPDDPRQQVRRRGSGVRLARRRGYPTHRGGCRGHARERALRSERRRARRARIARQPVVGRRFESQLRETHRADGRGRERLGEDDGDA